jgi:hypothetical protein
MAGNSEVVLKDIYIETRNETTCKFITEAASTRKAVDEQTIFCFIALFPQSRA